jgi:hypothetical protein
MKREGDFDSAESGFATVVPGPPVTHWSPKTRLNFGHRSNAKRMPLEKECLSLCRKTLGNLRVYFTFFACAGPA